MADAKPLVIGFHGRNGFDPPSALQPDECVEALNVDWYGSTLARKRGGATSVATTGGTAFAGIISSLFRHVPTQDDTAAELWGVDETSPPVVKRLAGGTAFADVTLDDSIGIRPEDVTAATLNGKLVLAYGTGAETVDHTYTVATSGTSYTVGSGVTVLRVKCWGAGGGSDGGDGSKNGGGGGYAQADLAVTPGETLTVKVGGAGLQSDQTFQGGSGGGFTGIYRGSVPLLIAGGGGGASADGAGGAGGGTNGVAGGGQGGAGGIGITFGGPAGGPTGTPAVDYLIVGGGGAGGAGSQGLGGGGGGGGVKVGTVALALGANYTVTVGAGGSAANGGDSSFDSITAAGGGKGGDAGSAGSNGGCGGGGGASTSSTNAGGTGSAGGNGGTSVSSAGSLGAAGGGGGAGANGSDGTWDIPTDHSFGGGGGAGVASSISGSSVTYGGGGGGAGRTTSGSGGTGGGGTGSGLGGGNGTDGLGGGGGGASGTGGKGVVVLRYVTGTLQASGGTITTSGSYTIHTFTSTGTFAVGTAATSGGGGAGGVGGGWLVGAGGDAGATGGTNGGGAGGSYGTSSAKRSGGGGGGGYEGGGGGSGDRANAATGGGGGGSSFASGTNITITAGVAAVAGNASDTDYGSSAGAGGSAGNGNPGRLVIIKSPATDRLHAYDPSLASPRVRRVGLASGSAPTAADHGSGSYAATARYYRQRTIQLNGSIVVRRSEPSASVSFTPSGSGASARVTQATPPSEGETHWEIEASTDNVVFYRLSQTVIATTTYDDSAATTTYSANPLSDPIGMYALPTAVRFVLATDSRLLMAGAYKSGGKNNRVWWTPVLGSSDQGDDERIPTLTSSVQYTDLSELSGNVITGLAGPIFNGTVYAFMQREVWRLTPTGDDTAPYLSRQLSDTVGAVHQKAVVMGEDESGQPAIYFWSYFGPYRIGKNGLQYIGHDVEDYTYGLNGQSAINLVAANMAVWGDWHGPKHQVWFHIATGSHDDPNVRLVFDAKLGMTTDTGEVRRGWSVHTGAATAARCGVQFSNTIGAQMSRDLKPYVSVTSGTTLLKCDTTDTDDNGTAFQAYVRSGSLIPVSQLASDFGASESYLQAAASSGVTITQSMIRDWGVETRTSTVSLTPSASETRVMRQFEGSAMSDATALQVQIGDASAVSNAWNLDALVLQVQSQGKSAS